MTSIHQEGVTTDHIDEVVHQACIDHKAYPSPLNYKRFPKSVCTSVNNVMVHGIPDSRPLRNGDIINIDVTVSILKCWLRGLFGGQPLAVHLKMDDKRKWQQG